MPLLETKGAASAQGFGGAGAGASGPVTYIEDVFSTYLYTGNGSTQTITNGINLAGKGGLVWTKSRTETNNPDGFQWIRDTSRGITNRIAVNSTDGQIMGSDISSTTSSGFNLGFTNGDCNRLGNSVVSWTFREQPKFFDIVTYTGNGANRTISHNLGSVPGCIIVKRTDAAANWQVYHRSLANTQYLVLNDTAAAATSTTLWNSTTPTSTVFSLGTDTTVNASGGTYVAYLFAHNAGGFGLTGTDNVISCGSYTGNNLSVLDLNLGYEPQWIMIKQTNVSLDWYIFDVLRGQAQKLTAGLFANLSAQESVTSAGPGSFITAFPPNATGIRILDSNSASGFYQLNAAGNSYIYIAIRRGPMKVPTSGTSVFGLNARTGTGANATVTGSAGVSDAVLIKNRGFNYDPILASRLTGPFYLRTPSTAGQTGPDTTVLQDNPWDVMDGVKVGTTSVYTNKSADTFINYLFDRAPSFFDIVLYTGNGTARTINHNLTVAPELMIVKQINQLSTREWSVYSKYLTSSSVQALYLNTTDAAFFATFWNSTDPTSTVFSVSTNINTNDSGKDYINYLFASCPGVSKVGSYTGTGALQTINCGFTGGARFVLIKRTDSTGDWYVYDSARGISSSNDPYFFLNSTAAEVTGTNYVDTTSVGFQVTAAAPAGLNANGGSFVFLAIA